MMAIGQCVILIKGIESTTTVLSFPFFSPSSLPCPARFFPHRVSSARQTGVSRDHGPAKKPVEMIPERTLHVASVLLWICIWSAQFLADVHIHPPVSCFFPLLFLPSRSGASPSCLSTWTHTGAAAASVCLASVVVRGGGEGREGRISPRTKRDLVNGPI